MPERDAFQELIDERKLHAIRHGEARSKEQRELAGNLNRIAQAAPAVVRSMQAVFNKANATLQANNLTEQFSYKEVGVPDTSWLHQAEFLLRAKGERYAVAGGRIRIGTADGRIAIDYTCRRDRHGQVEFSVVDFDEDGFADVLVEVFKAATD